MPTPILTLDKFKKMFPNNKKPEEIMEIFKKYFAKYNINTTNRRAGFLAQCGHESNGFTVFKENLNYHTHGLRTVFGKYFQTEELAKEYEMKPEKIANRVYANRMGNGPESSGDGWKYAGKGAIQITGKDNYKAFANSKGVTLDEISKYMTTLEGAIESALWFWFAHGINMYCDSDDIVTMTKVINGGTNGLKDRTKNYEKYKIILGA
jgi:putative chitinase